MLRCAISSSFLSMSWLLLPGSWVRVAFVLWSPSPFSPSNNSDPQIVRDSGHPIYAPSDRLVAGLCALLIRPARLIRSAIVLKPSTLLNFHQVMRNRKYRLLFSSKRRGKPGPKGPNKELIEAVVQMKQRNPAWAVRELLNRLPWLSTSNRQRRCSKDSRQPLSAEKGLRWSILADLHWPHERQPLESRSVPVRIGHVADPLGLGRHGSTHPPDHGFGVHAGTVTGVALCRMFHPPFDGNPGCQSTSAPTMIPVSVWAVASQSADPGGDRNQDRFLCSPVPSLCGTADRHDSTRVFGSHVVLEDGGSG